MEEFARSLESLSEADGRPFEEFLDTALTNISKRSSEVAWICRLLKDMYRTDMLLLINGTHLGGLQILCSNSPSRRRRAFETNLSPSASCMRKRHGFEENQKRHLQAQTPLTLKTLST